MLRLPVLTRLFRRFPIRIAAWTQWRSVATAQPLPETDFVEEDGRFDHAALGYRHSRSTLTALCAPSAHPAALLAASGSYLEIVDRLTDGSAHRADTLDQAELMVSLASRCHELAATSPDPLPLLILKLNWLGFAIGEASLPQASLALFHLLRAWDVPPYQAIQVLEPGIRFLATLLDENDAANHRLPEWLEAASSHLQTLPAGLDCLFEATGILLKDPDLHAPDHLRDFVYRARHWLGRARPVLAQAQRPWPLADRLEQRLARLAQWVDLAPYQPLPGYYGFPVVGDLPAIRISERLGALYTGAAVSPIFLGERFRFDALLAADTTPMTEFLADDVDLLQTVADAGGDDADFHALAEGFHDQLDALSAQDPEAPWNETRSLLFLRALTCRALAVVRNQHWISTDDLHAVVKRYAKDEEQEAGVTEDTALLLFAPLAAVIDESLRVGCDGQAVQVEKWIAAYKSPQPNCQEAGRARLQQLRFAWLSMARLIEEGRDMLVNLAGAHGQSALRARVGDLVDDLKILDELPEMGLMLGSDARVAMDSLSRAERAYQNAAEKRYASLDTPASSVNTSGNRAAVPKSSAAKSSDGDGEAKDSGRIPVIDAKTMSNYADSKTIKESWSQKKADQLRAGVTLIPTPAGGVTTLREEFPWFTELLDFLEMWLERNASLGVTDCRLPPLLLLGGYGSGKTYFGKRLAEVLEVPHRLLAVGGSTDNRQLAGTSRGWSSAYPSLPVDFMAETGVGNGLLVVDELDKESHDRRNGRMTDTLLQLLEPANAKAFMDPFLGCPVDCSHLQWLLTCNSLKGINAALLSRVRLFTVSQPSRSHYPRLAQQIRHAFAREYQVDPRFLPSLDGDDLDLIQTQCKSVRQVRQITEWIITRKIAEERGGARVH